MSRQNPVRKSKKTKKVAEGDKRDDQGRREKFKKEEHLAVIEQSLIEGVPERDIIEAGCKEFKVSERQMYRDLKTVWKRWERAGLKIRTERMNQRSLALAILRRHHLYNQALADRQYKDALDAERDRCTLEGIYPKKEIGLSGVPGSTTSIQVNQHNVLAPLLEKPDAKRLSDIFGILEQAGALTPEALDGEDAAQVDEVHPASTNGETERVPAPDLP